MRGQYEILYYTKSSNSAFLYHDFSKTELNEVLDEVLEKLEKQYGKGKVFVVNINYCDLKGWWEK